MVDILRELEGLDREIKKAERDVQTEEGKVSAYMETLNKEWGLKSIEEAEEKLKSLADEKACYDGMVSEKFSSLKEQYKW